MAMTPKNSIARTQNRRVVITTPFPTPDEVAAELGIPPKRLAELRQMIAEIRAEDERRAARRQRSKRGTAKPAKKK
jgi:hypothetical protein